VVLFDYLCDEDVQKSVFIQETRCMMRHQLTLCFHPFNRVMLFGSLKEVCSKVICDSIRYVNPHNTGIIQPIISHNRNSPTIKHSSRKLGSD